MRSRKWTFISLAVAAVILFATGPALAQVCPGETVDERAVNCAKEYIQKKGLKDPTLVHLAASLWMKGQVKLDAEWKKLTGVTMKNVEYGYTEIPSKIMAEAVAKSGRYDLFNHFVLMLPDAAESGVIRPLDEYAARGKPDFSDIAPALRAQQYYKGKFYFFFLDGDQYILLIRKDLASLPEARKAFFEKFGWYPRCPDTWSEWYQLVSFFNAKKGEDFYGMKMESDLYGGIGYRSRNFAYRWWLPRFFSKGKLFFDENMHPLVNGPEGWEATEEFVAITKFMPKDILGWASAQLVPFFFGGHTFSANTWPGFVGPAERSPQSKVRGKVFSCPIPGSYVKGKIKRISMQTAGCGYMVSTYSKHPELAYYFLQWQTSPKIGNKAVADADSFWDPFRYSQVTDPEVQKTYTKQMLEVHINANGNCAVPMFLIPGNREYYNALDVRLAEALQGMATPKEAMRRVAEDWERITEDIGRQKQIEAWRAQVKQGSFDTPKCTGWVPEAVFPAEDY